MKFAAMMRVRNEERWISDVIASLLPIAERIFIMDDHSIDMTANICRLCDRVELFESPFEGLDETRDKNWLLRRVAMHRPEWVLCIDGDEVLEPSGPEKIKQITSGSRRADACSFRVLYLWNDRHTVRKDGVYGRFHRPSMFRLASNWDSQFMTTACGGNLHCSSVPQEFLPGSVATDVSLLHYGYIDRSMRLRKYAYYNSVDPGNDREDQYRHIVQGDIKEVPARARLQHAGPLRLEPLSL